MSEVLEQLKEAQRTVSDARSKLATSKKERTRAIKSLQDMGFEISNTPTKKQLTKLLAECKEAVEAGEAKLERRMAQLEEMLSELE